MEGTDGSSVDAFDVAHDDETLWEKCLTKFEFDAYQTYRSEWPDQVYSLNQSPDKRPTYTTDNVPKQQNKQVFILTHWFGWVVLNLVCSD